MPNGRKIGVTLSGGANPDIGMDVQTGGQGAAVNAEAWAVGERGGVPVGPTDPVYRNNAKWNAEQAAQEASDAEAWANGTRDGVPVGNDDPAYQKNGPYFRGLSQADANAAAASAAAAAQNAQQAAGHVTAAATAKDAAEAAAQEARETVVAAQGPGICYVDTDGIPYVLE